MEKEKDKGFDTQAIENEHGANAQDGTENSDNTTVLSDKESETEKSVKTSRFGRKQKPAVNREAELQKEIAELKDKHLRLFSEFDNFRKRTQREKADLLRMASADLLSALLPVLDDFERATKSMENSTDINALREGVDLIQNKFRNLLIQKGLEPMDSLGKEFDTDHHEAITNIPAPSEELKGKVIDVIEKGYTLQGKVLRFAKVVVGS